MKGSEKPISRRSPPVVVSYLSGQTRVEKYFDDPYEARRFYVQKFNQGREPKLKKGTHLIVERMSQSGKSVIVKAVFKLREN